MRSEQCSDLSEEHTGTKYHHTPYYTKPPANLHTKASDKGDTSKSNSNKGDIFESSSYKGVTDESSQPKTEINLKAETWEEGEI